jgi:hypothetical protein
MSGGPVYLDRFQARAGLITWDMEALARIHLAPDFAQILHAAALIEEDTALTVRQCNSLGFDRLADLAPFLPQWEAEEAEHGRALRALVAHQTPVAGRGQSGRRRSVDHLVASVPARFIGRRAHAPFIFCALGAAAEYVATAIYAELANRANPPALSQLLRSIARQEARHLAFFLAAARVRGSQMSSLDGRFSRSVLGALWAPIGVPTLGKEAWLELFAEWLDDDHFRNRLEMMDRVVDSIPQLAGMRLMGTFLDEVA